MAKPKPLRERCSTYNSGPGVLVSSERQEREPSFSWLPPLPTGISIVTFFGEHKISIRGEQLPPIKGKKNNSILAYLLYYYQKPIHKEVLMERFWPNTPAASAKNSLNVAIYTIRKYFDAYFEDFNLILLEKENYYINSELDIHSDIKQFLKFWEKGRSIEMTEGAQIIYGAYNKAL